MTCIIALIRCRLGFYLKHKFTWFKFIKNIMILQFGKIPPPIGGVSIHVKRLIQSSLYFNLKNDIFDYSKNFNFFILFKKIIKNKIIHIHLSRGFPRFIFTLIFKLFFKKVVVTFHGNYNFSNLFDFFTLKLATAIIVLNDSTFDHAKKKNAKNLYKIGAFLPDDEKDIQDFQLDTIDEIFTFKKTYKYVYCTYAWAVSIDYLGNEIYGGSLLIDLFKRNSSIALIFSDPNGSYKKYFLDAQVDIPKNVFFVSYPHSFKRLVESCDCFIRATTTDGDSLAVNEALYYQRSVIASNVVDRPDGCILYQNTQNLEHILLNFNLYNNYYKEYIYVDNLKLLSKLYNDIYFNLID